MIGNQCVAAGRPVVSSLASGSCVLQEKGNKAKHGGQRRHKEGAQHTRGVSAQQTRAHQSCQKGVVMSKLPCTCLFVVVWAARPTDRPQTPTRSRAPENVGRNLQVGDFLVVPSV